MADTITVLPDDRGALTIRDSAAETIARKAALAVPHVVPRSAGLSKLTGRGLPRVEVTIRDRHIRAALDVAIVWPAPTARTAAEIRASVAAGLARYTAMTVDAVDVTVLVVAAEAIAAAPASSVRQQRRVQ
ncbi:Asp23/Gls24 family envelope stress response protein [Rhodococcoides kyotonense]|uniref:Uncharacterized conserved protein YloU, alkaline shock protein (Asp23) family n=1 Tax=Rhodococcoides kyotonense TaxID=398843 RepID=A0A239MFN4_9NOCA|nr:Asp23/Gls24 family envelope stress response protein [Rhodococcus kyotonensis]SNT40924.1 Uncharacterized conserved protein YloU, alkaline shock protein (Asp23) family [Rhodococcus kyotonensis]